jgi:hypothetical protein
MIFRASFILDRLPDFGPDARAFSARILAPQGLPPLPHLRPGGPERPSGVPPRLAIGMVKQANGPGAHEPRPGAGGQRTHTKMRTTPKIVVAGLASCLVLAVVAVAHASAAPQPDTGVQQRSEARRPAAAPGAIALCVLGVVVMLMPRRGA